MGGQPPKGKGGSWDGCGCVNFTGTTGRHAGGRQGHAVGLRHAEVCSDGCARTAARRRGGGASAPHQVMDQPSGRWRVRGAGGLLRLNANGLRWLFVLAALVTGGSAVFVYLALYLVLPWSDRPVKAARHGERRGTVGFAGRLVLWLVLAAAVWAYMGSRLVGLYSQLGMALGPAAKWSMVSLQFLLYSPTGWVLLGLSFAALVGVRHVGSDDAAKRRAYDLAVYLALAALLLFWIVTLYGSLWNIPRIVVR